MTDSRSIHISTNDEVKKRKIKIVCKHIYAESRNMVQVTCFQGENRDVENGHSQGGEEVEGGTN